MLNSFYKGKKNRYINSIVKITNNPNIKNKHEILSKILTEYHKFCYRHDLDTYDEKLCSIDSNIYISLKVVLYLSR